MPPEPAPPSKPQLPLSLFRAVLNAPARDGEPLFIVGGHAVNSWAHHFISRRPELARFKPFTSKDLDCVGTLDDVWHLKQATGWEYLPGKADPKEFIAGAIRHEPKDGPVLLVEVLKRAQGADMDELLENAVRITFDTEDERHCVRVPDPVLMLKLKMENAISFAQDTPGRERQDIKHVRMMTLCCSAFLEEIVEEPDLEIRPKLALLNRALKGLASLHEGHVYTRQFREAHGWEVKECVPQNVLELVQKDEPIFRELRRNLTRLGFDTFGNPSALGREGYPAALRNPTPVELLRQRNLPKAASTPRPEDIVKLTPPPKPKGEQEEIG
jgi:hypothetical protein